MCLRVRVAERIFNKAVPGGEAYTGNGTTSAVNTQYSSGAALAPSEQRVLDHVAEALARLGRSKRVGLVLEDKVAFVEAWHGKKKVQ